MNRIIITCIELTSLALPAHAEYVRSNVSQAQKDEAYCNSVATGAQRGYLAMGSSNYVAGAAIGNVIAVSMATKNCMTMLGYSWKKPKRTLSINISGAKPINSPYPN